MTYPLNAYLLRRDSVSASYEKCDSTMRSQRRRLCGVCVCKTVRRSKRQDSVVCVRKSRAHERRTMCVCRKRVGKSKKGMRFSANERKKLHGGHRLQARKRQGRVHKLHASTKATRLLPQGGDVSRSNRNTLGAAHSCRNRHRQRSNQT